MAARSRQSRRVRSRHRADPGKIPRQRRDCANAGRVRSIGPGAGIRAGARRGRRVQRGRRRGRAEEGCGRWREAAEHPLAGRVRTPAQRRDLFRLPPDARHRRLSFPRRRLDGGQSRRIRPSCRRRRISSATRSAAAIFSQACATASRRITRADLPAVRNCAAAPNSPAPIITTAGARIAMCRASRPPSNDGSFRDWTCAEGLTCQAAGKISRIGMCFVKSR